MKKYPLQLAKTNSLLSLLVIMVLFVCRMWLPYSLSLVWDAVIMGVGTCVYVQLRHSNWLSKVLSFFGKHSFNIFLFYTFFLIYIPQYIYWNRNPLLIFLTMLLTCIVVSVVIEYIKMIFGINKVQQLLIGSK